MTPAERAAQWERQVTRALDCFDRMLALAEAHAMGEGDAERIRRLAGQIVHALEYAPDELPGERVHAIGRRVETLGARAASVLGLRWGAPIFGECS